MTALLPAGFAALEPFLPDWSGETAGARAGIRDDTDLEAMQAFHAAVEPLLGPAFAHLDARPLAEQDARDERLMRLLLTFAHIALAVEVQREEEPMHRMLRPSLHIRRTPADLPT